MKPTDNVKLCSTKRRKREKRRQGKIRPNVLRKRQGGQNAQVDLEALRRDYRLNAEDFLFWIIDRKVPDASYHPVPEFRSEPVIRERPMGRTRSNSI